MNTYRREIVVLQELKRRGNNLPGFPKLVSYKETATSAEFLVNVSWVTRFDDSRLIEIDFFVIQALGSNIESLTSLNHINRLSLATCYKFTYLLISNLRRLHDMNFVHNNLNLENILVGKTDPNMIYLVDFGLARHWRNPYTDRHEQKVQQFKF